VKLWLAIAVLATFLVGDLFGVYSDRFAGLLFVPFAVFLLLLAMLITRVVLWVIAVTKRDTTNTARRGDGLS
jgi:hypothetical protein